MTLGERIKIARERAKLNQVDFAEKIGVSKQTLYKYENNIITNIPSDKIEKVAEVGNVSPSWLMGWDNALDKHVKLFENVGVKVPVLGSIPAGIPIEAIEDIVDWEEIPSAWLNGEQEYFALRVTGDSMFPKYQEGDTIIIRKQDDCESGQDCVVYVNGYDATLKKVIKNMDHIILQPLNPAYEPKIFDYNDEFRPVKIAGVVVELRRKI